MAEDLLVMLLPGIYWHIMPKRRHLEPHLGMDELEWRYRRARDPVERSHLQIVWLLSVGHHAGDEVAVPEGSAWESLPPYSPEFQPTERLWPLTDEGSGKPAARGPG